MALFPKIRLNAPNASELLGKCDTISDIPAWEQVTGSGKLNLSKMNPADSPAGDQKYQTSIIPGVSRTFALTIPTLPEPLSRVIGNAYLLCRIADTIEDDPDLARDQKETQLERFLEVVKGREDAETFAASVVPLLSPDTPASELDLMRNVPRVIRITHSLSEPEQTALSRCVAVMCADMPKYQQNNISGLRDLDEMGAYCYTVAGVVGEMLFDLFRIRFPELEARHTEMRSLAISFGQALQMTNILKDVWDDRRRGACWLPISVFPDGQFDPEHLDENHRSPEFQSGLQTLIGVTHGHLKNALDFTCHLPTREVGVRRFCLWALGLAVLTLRKIHRNPYYRSANEVKVTRRTVWITLITTSVLSWSNRCLRQLFRLATAGLPNREVRLPDSSGSRYSQF